MSNDPYNRFTNAVVTRLLADTNLVALLGHTATTIRIAEANPVKKGRVPFLGVLHIETIPAVENALSALNRTLFAFECHGGRSPDVKKIAGRVSALLDGATNSISGDLGDLLYFNFTNSEVRVHSCRRKSVEGPVQDVDTEIWLMSVTAEAIWIDVVCS